MADRVDPKKYRKTNKYKIKNMMKTKLIFSLAVMMLFSSMALAQNRYAVETLVATTEEDVYKLYDRMLDSTRLSNRFIISDPSNDNINYFGMVVVREMNSRDTMMLFDRRENTRIWRSYISNGQPIAFYGRFIDHIQKAVKRESIFVRREATDPLRIIRRILVNRQST